MENIPPLFGYLLMVVGVADMVIAKVIFGKQLKLAQEKIKPGMSPEAKAPLEAKYTQLKLVTQSLTFMGIFLLLAGGFVAMNATGSL